MIGLLPCSVEEIDLVCRPTIVKPIWHYGVQIYGLRYNSPSLQQLRQRIGVNEHDRSVKDVVIYLNHDDLGEVAIFDSYAKEFIYVDAVDQDDTRGLTLHMHRLIRRNRAVQGKNPEHDDIRARAKRKTRQEVETLSSSASLKDRKKAAKTNRQRLQTSSEPVPPTQNLATQIGASALEAALKGERESYSSFTLPRRNHGR